MPSQRCSNEAQVMRRLVAGDSQLVFDSDQAETDQSMDYGVAGVSLGIGKFAQWRG